MDEHITQRSVIAAFRKLGVYVLRINSGSPSRRYRGAPAGTSDLLVILKGGRACWIEMKKPGEKPTKEQSDFLAARAKDGCLTGVATTVDEALEIAGLATKRRRG